MEPRPPPGGKSGLKAIHVPGFVLVSYLRDRNTKCMQANFLYFKANSSAVLASHIGSALLVQEHGYLSGPQEDMNVCT